MLQNPLAFTEKLVVLKISGNKELLILLVNPDSVYWPKALNSYFLSHWKTNYIDRWVCLSKEEKNTPLRSESQMVSFLNRDLDPKRTQLVILSRKSLWCLLYNICSVERVWLFLNDSEAFLKISKLCLP